MIHARALRRLRVQLIELGSVFIIPSRGSASVLSTSVEDSTLSLDVPVLETTYVDDECLFVCAKSAAELDERIAVVLENLLGVFEAFKLDINWNKGKSEAILKYRGKEAQQ